MTYNYLWLINRLCQKMGEVELYAIDVPTAQGVYADFKSAINAAIGDICQQQDNEWPFNWVSQTDYTTIGINEYTKPVAAVNIDWDSFRIKRQPVGITSITQVGGLATATVSGGHLLITGDNVRIYGANQADYVGNFTVTVTSSTTFTFSVSASAVTPATGTLYLIPPFATKKLTQIDYDAYREEGWEERDDNMLGTDQFGVPDKVVRKPDNNFIISPRPNRIYPINYNYYTMPSDLVLYSDVPVIPEEWKETIVKGAIYHCYLFRDNIEEAAKAQDDFNKDVVSMRRILIPIPSFMRVTN